MRIASFNDGRVGLIVEESIIDVTELAGVTAGAWPPFGMTQLIARFAEIEPLLRAALDQADRRPLSSVRLGTPIAWPNKVVAFPANYHDHIAEMENGPGLISLSKTGGQGFFLKANSSLSGPEDPIVLPDMPDREVHHECELAIIIGKRGRHIPREAVDDYIFGYSCLIDAVVRGKEERVMRKSFDSFCPVGPYITTRDEVADYSNIAMELSVNGEVRQQANTRNLIVDIPEMIALSSSVMTLEPGDIIATGTPAGVGPMSPGDKVTISVTGIGTMTLDVVKEQIPPHKLWENRLG